MNPCRKSLWILGALLLLPRFTFAQAWTPTSAPSNNWAAVVCSVDGSKIIVAAGGQFNSGLIYASTNSGLTWVASSAPSNHWISVASSADGSRFLAVAYGGGLYSSTNFGADWQSNSVGTHIWYSVASSADGFRWYAAYFNSLVFGSTNGGNTWFSNSTAVSDVHTLAASAAGDRLFAGKNTGLTAASTNSGASWVTRTSVHGNIYSLAGSADGTRLIAVSAGLSYPYVSTSTNGGVNWTSNNLPIRSDWYYSDSSADGTRLAVAGQKGVIYTSTNSGLNWVSNDIPQWLWTSIASSADGSLLVAVSQNQGVWIRRTTVKPVVKLAFSGGGLKLSWPVTATNVSVQQSADLLNWNSAALQPVLNNTNLQNEVILPNTPGNAFYRLTTP